MVAGDGFIALVEDDPTDIAIFQAAYRNSGLTRPVLTFTTGEAFLAHLSDAKSASKPMPGVVLLDVNMPGKNGIQLLNMIRNDPEIDPQPYIVMLTGSRQEKDINQAMMRGCNRYIGKFNSTEAYSAFLAGLI